MNSCSLVDFYFNQSIQVLTGTRQNVSQGEVMNMKEELTKLLMESYDRGVADAKKAAITAIEQAIILEREACAEVCVGLEAQPEEFDALNRAAAAIRARSQL